VGTPPVLSLKAIEPALELVQAAGTKRLRQKASNKVYLIELAEAWL
jgi:kynureninase